jgi:hypothetical protein
MSEPIKWTEHEIQVAIATQLFRRKYLVVPNCGWTGHECDLLVIDKSLRIIDVEVKISRADLKQDNKKQKWYETRPWSKRHLPEQRRQWPDKVWKHYYVIPADIWQDSLYKSINASSGVVLVRRQKANNKLAIELIRMAKPDRQAKQLSPADAVDIARLVSLRYWNQK